MRDRRQFRFACARCQAVHFVDAQTHYNARERARRHGWSIDRKGVVRCPNCMRRELRARE